MSDIVTATAAKLGVKPQLIFIDAMQKLGVKDPAAQAGYRFQRWFKFGDITPLVENYCLDFWAPRRSDGDSSNGGNAA